jgi:hypothetical protein
VRSREAAVEAREERCDAREAELGSSPARRRNYRNPADTFTPIAGSGMSRSFPEQHTVRHDDLGQEFPQHVSLTRTVTGAE